ncbi:hypothetical protein IHE44_0000575 [Lamprotornis superbus]|uniref:Little elongation complex subunit 1 C-terminal domain-containing protein n=1 Tax=Lamprotornis superbus TaxID=245042 RepID=A0A835P5U8_9PASS|nr:hypothetical protein IHE44_0000575 [Lamprotornis superbus]
MRIKKVFQVLHTIQLHQKIKKCGGKTQPWCSSVKNAVKQNSVTAMIIPTSTEPLGDDRVENRTAEECMHSDEDKTVDAIIQTSREHSTSDFSDQEQRDPGGNVVDILNWARPLPALLSPIQLSPLSRRDMLLGEVTDSSDEEDDCSTSAVESILQEDQVEPPSCNVISPSDECNRQSKSCEHGFDAEISLNLTWNEKNIHISPNMERKEERDAERKQAEGATPITNMETNKDCLEENSEDMETEDRELTGATAHEQEDMEEQKGDGKRKTKTPKVTQPVLANADTSVATKCSAEMINKIREEIGPPLPPLLLPLIATPPKTACTVSPVMSSTGQSSLLSPLDDLVSPLCETPILPLVSPLADTPTVKSALLFSPPSPSEMAVGRRIRSSPLKFCTSIPKHALPVPGRFPLFAAVSAGAGAPQENSVKILDTMYPELSARARTLNILKGNIQFNRCAFSDSQSLPGPVSQTGGFKAIASTSTAFVKAGSSLKSDSCKDEDKDVQNQQLFSRSSNHVEKRTLLQVSMPRSAKRLRLDSEPPRMEPSDITAVRNTKNTISEVQEAFHGKSYEISDSSQSSNLEESLPVKKDPDCQKISLALKKVAESCFDLLPVIKGHVYVGNISKIPVMRDEEREVVYEFAIKNKHLADSLLHVILNTLKAQKNATNYNLSQALCRVYAGICRQLGDLERARLFCYSLLKEGFPDSEKLILFITNVWSDIFVFQGAVNKAMQLVVRQSANNEVLACLSAYLNWEQSSSLDAGVMISNLLLEMQSCTKVEFHPSEHYGEDLSEDAWQYIFAVDLLCSHMKWDWTHDNVISKVLWPFMDNWIKKRKGHETAQSIHDSVIALTLRLIGRLGRIGLKEGSLAAVKNISSVIGLFVQHAEEEGVPWGVQLAAVYSLCDLGSSNPEGIVEAIHAWRAKVLNKIPSAITNGIAEIASLCEMELN